LIVGISGASGAIVGVRLLEALKAMQVETHLVLILFQEGGDMLK
jgi:flavin prenyltransferase